MSSECVFPLDQEAIELFALKGTQAGSGTPQINNANGLTVRRMMQLISDFSKKPFDQLQILDLACGEGVYAIEAALRNAGVRALDARTERMSEGAEAAKRLGLHNLHFEQADIRNVNIGSHGSVDVVLFLGILYHLDQRDIYPVLKNLYEMCRQFVVIDTHIALHGRIKIELNGQTYQGKHFVEHAKDDTEAVRQGRLQASLDNPLSFWLTKESLFRLLKEVGFTSVCECNVPLDPFKPSDRITIIAAKGTPVQVSSYPWVNGKTEDEIKHIIADNLQAARKKHGAARRGILHFPKATINRILHICGLEIRRI